MGVSDIEKGIIKYWNENSVFEKSLEKTKHRKPYIFYDGPPFATGLPHYGHLLASILKDVFPRFFTMKGFYVKRVWGWDCHGLPIENIAERDLNINSKAEIEKMGVKKFNDYCRSKVLTYAEEWKKYIERIGRWVDWEGGYKTMDTKYIESVWWAFKQLYEKGYIYEGEKVLMYCPRCSTPLAKSEIAMDNSYKKVKDISVVVKFKIVGEKNTYALAWTTTPWTLPSNLALSVNPNLEYVYVYDLNDRNTYILAKSLLSNFYKGSEDYKIVKEVLGKDLEGVKYEPLFSYFSDVKGAFKIILGDFVSAEEGTGIVHTAPAFGEDDNYVCRKYGISSVQPVDEFGKFTKEVKDYFGEYVHDVNEKIVSDLKKAGKIVFSRKIEHDYPFCYRCDTKLMYRALPALFVNIDKIRERLLEINERINWIPSFLKDGRVKNNILTAPDWNITRNRYWASAIPIWKSKSGKIKVIGSIEELKKYAKNLPSGEVDLHKDYLDLVELEIDGEIYKRIPEVLDCWFESGSMTFAQFHYPFENKEFFEKNFPAQFVVEYIAQTRAWFYYMMVLSAILFDKEPFENVLNTGTILADDGEKMSKSKNNFNDPLELIEKFGADSLRFYLLQSSVMNAEDFNFVERDLEETYRKVILIIYNVLNFYKSYQKDGDENFEMSENYMDKWILGKVEKLCYDVESNLEKYNTIKACFSIKVFVEDLSNWYVRVSRERFNEEDFYAGKTLRYVLDKFSKIIAPILPFVSEKIHQDLNGEGSSVHLCDWPGYDSSLIVEGFFEEMDFVRDIVSIGLRKRDACQIGLKWPLSEAVVKTNRFNVVERYRDVIMSELNVKSLKIINSDGELDVEINTKITRELEEEGFLREITRNIQALRKKAGLVKKDRINIKISSDFNDILSKNKKVLSERVGAKDIFFSDFSEREVDFFVDGNIKGKKFKVGFLVN